MIRWPVFLHGTIWLNCIQEDIGGNFWKCCSQAQTVHDKNPTVSQTVRISTGINDNIMQICKFMK